MADKKKRTLGDDLRDFRAGKIGDKFNTNKPVPFIVKTDEVRDTIPISTMLSEKVKADTPKKAVHTVPTQEQYYQRLATAKNITTVPTKEQQFQYKSDVNTLNQLQQYQNKQKYDEAYRGYNYAQLKSELAKTDRDSDKDLYSYLENKANERITSADIVKELEKLDKELGTLIPFVEKDDIRRREIEDELEVLETLKKKKEFEEKKQNNYTNVIEKNSSVLTALQKYYALKKADETEKMLKATGHGISSVKVQSTIDSYNFAKALSQEEKEKIITDFENIDNKDELYKYFVRDQEEKESIEENTVLQDYAEDYPVLGSLASVSLNTYGSVSDAVKYVGAGVDSAFGGEGYINPNATNVAKAQVLREKVSEDMNGVGKFLYNTGMSMVDNVARLPVTALPGGKALSLAIAGTSSGVSSANDVIERGGSLEDALFTGGASAIAEIVFEKIPLDNLIKIKNKGTDSVKKAILTQIGTEAGEEFGTESVNIVADYIINQDLSQFSLQYQEYIKQGYSEAEASKKIAVDIGLQLGQSVLAGGISGGFFSGGALLLNYGGHKFSQKDIENLNNKETRKQLGEEALANEDFDLNNLIAQGKISGNKKAVKLANSIERTIANSGKDKITAGDVGNLMYLMSLDRPNNNYEVEDTAKQKIINDSYTMGGASKTEVVSTTQQTANNKNSKKTTDAFGKAHTYGIAVKTRTGGTLTVMGIESSAKDFGASDNNVILRTENGGKINADDVTPLLPEFQQLFNYAKNFDTLGARHFVKEYESYLNRAEETGKKASVEAYAKAFEDLYSLGKMGVTYDSVKKSGAYESTISTLGAGVAYAATKGGNQDTNVTRQSEHNKVQKIRVPGEANSINSKMYVEPGSESSVVATDEQLQLLQAVAQKVGRDIVLTNKLVDDITGVSKNGKYENGKIYIRADLNENYMLAVALHEATHDLRANSPLEYQALCDFIMNYLVAKGENVNSLLDNIKDNWKDNVSTEDEVLEELVCQTVMVIATDEKAIETVLNIKENKNILQKVASALKKIAQYTYDFMKGIGFAKHNLQAQAWLDDAKAIQMLAEKLSSALDKNRNANIMQSEQQKNNTPKGAKYSVGYTDENIPVVIIDDDILNNVPKKEWINTVKSVISEKFSKGIAIQGKFIKVNKTTKNEYTNSKYSKHLKRYERSIYKDKLKSANNLDEIVIASTKYINEDLNHERKDNIKEFARGEVLIRVGTNDYIAEIVVGFTSNSEMLLYDIINFTRTKFKIKKVDTHTAEQHKAIGSRTSVPTNKNVSQKNNNVKSKLSVDDTILDEGYYDVLKKLDNNDIVSLEEIADMSVIKDAVRKRGEFNPTIKYADAKREELRKNIQSEVESLGSAVELDDNWVYNGVVERDRRIDIVIGLPAAGKSSVLANPLSAYFKSRIVDSDIIKEKIPEFNNGLGANNVHEESKLINKRIMKSAFENGENIVLPIIGADYNKVMEIICDFKNLNYDIFLHLNELPMYKALGRAIKRYVETGRYVPFEIIYEYGNKPTQVFEKIVKENEVLLSGYTERQTSEFKRRDKQQNFNERGSNSKNERGSKILYGNGVFRPNGLLTGYSRYSNDVKQGYPPIFKEGTIDIYSVYKNASKDIRYSVDDTILDEFNIPNGKLSDSIFVQRQVYNTLINDNFFNDIDSESRTVVNKNSNMIIEINKSGIKETFSNKNFSSNSKSLKLLKLATIKKLPEIIENGVLIKDDVRNYHKENSTLKFAYIEHRVVANNNPVKVIVTIRKSLQKNKFWVHHVYIEKDTGSTSVGTSKSSITAYTTSDVNDTVPYDNGIVKPKLSVDDTIIDFNDDLFLDEDLFFEGTEEHINFEKVIKNSPADALNIIYNTASKTALTGISQFKDVKLDYKAYTSIARKVMKDYEIIKKHNPDAEAKIANTIRKYVELIENGNYSDGADVIEKLVLECKGYIALSGDYDKTVLQEEREAILGYLSGKTLLITDYSEDFVRENYGNVAKYRRQMMGKVSVGLERNAKSMSNTMYMDDVISFIEENYPMFITDECDSVQGFQWLDNLLNNILQPKFFNRFADGFYENADTTAIEMAFDMTTEVIDAKAKQLVKSKKADRKQVRELTKARKIAIAEREAMLKAKAENYKKQFQEERLVRTEQIKKLREKLKKQSEKSGRAKMRDTAKIKKLEKSLNEKTVILNKGYNTIRKEYNMKREKTANILRIHRIVEKFERRYLSPKKTENVPADIYNPLYDVLTAFFELDGKSKNVERLAQKMETLIRKFTAEVIDEQSIRHIPKAFQEALLGEYDEKSNKRKDNGLLYEVLNIFKTSNAKKIRDFSYDEIKQIRDAFEKIESILYSANDIVLAGKKYSAYVLSREIEKELQTVLGTHSKTDTESNIKAMFVKDAKTLFEKYQNEMNDPIRFARRITGYKKDSLFVKFFETLNIGQKDAMNLKMTWTNFALEAYSKFSEKELNDYKYKKALTIDGVDFTADMLVEFALEYGDLYAREHMMFSGYHVPNIQYFKRKKKSSAYSKDRSFFFVPTKYDVKTILDYVRRNELCRTIYSLCYTMYNVNMQNAVNDISLRKYGYQLAKVRNYCPITIDTDTVEKGFADVLINRSINSRAFLHMREKDRYNRLKLEGALDKLGRQIDSVSSWCGLTIPIENFTKVYNMERYDNSYADVDGKRKPYIALTENSDDKTIYFKSVKENLKLRWGDQADKYISKLMGDLQGSTKAEITQLDILTSNYIRGVLTGNIESAIVQISSYPLAVSVVGWKPVLAGIKHIRPGKHTPGINRILSDKYKHSVPYDELAKYTPVLWYRQQGNNSRDINEINKHKSLGDKSGILDKLNWIEKMDTTMINMNYWICYEYVKNELHISEDSSEFMPRIAETLEKIINTMMPNSSIMQQGQILRRKNPLVKVFTMCKSQVYCMANALMDSSGEYLASYKALKNAKQLKQKESIEDAKASLRESKIKYVRTFSAVVTSIAISVFLLDVISAVVTGKFDKYKDDDEQISFESVALRMLKDFGSEISGMFLFGDVIYDFVLACVDTEEKFWGISYPGVEVINDLFNGIYDLLHSDEKNFLDNLRSLIGIGGLAKGLPIKNLDKICQGIYNHFVNSVYYDFTPAVNNYGEVTMSKFANTCYNALVDGNKQLYETYHSQWLKQKQRNGEFVDEDYINSKLKEELEDDVVIIAAADAFSKGDLDKYESTVEKYVDYGFTEETVTKAIDSIIAESEEESEDEDIKSFDTESEKSTLYSYSDAFNFLKNGDEENYQRIKSYLIENAGKEEKDIKSAMRSASRTDSLWKEYLQAYEDSDGTKMREIKTMLTNIYGSWDSALEALHKYQKRMKEKENK